MLILIGLGSVLLSTRGFKFPWILSSSPTSTSTITLTLSPSSTSTRQATPDSKATRETQIRAFADPILADVLSRRPNHEADFSTYDPKWGSSFEVTFTDGVMHMRSPAGSVSVGGEHIAAADFVIQFDFSPVITVSSDQIQLLFRQGSGPYYGLGLIMDGSWYISYNNGTAGHPVCDGRTSLTRDGQTRTVLFIAQGSEMAFYLDGQPVGYCQDESTFTAEEATIAVDSSAGNIEVDFDNIEFWDLNELKP